MSESHYKSLQVRKASLQTTAVNVLSPFGALEPRSLSPMLNPEERYTSSYNRQFATSKWADFTMTEVLMTARNQSQSMQNKVDQLMRAGKQTSLPEPVNEKPDEMNGFGKALNTVTDGKIKQLV